MKKLNKYSSSITQDNSQPAAQAMLYAIGFSDEDFNKPLIGIASTGYEGNPCNMHLNNIALEVKAGVNSIDFVGLILIQLEEVMEFLWALQGCGILCHLEI